jgi:hypothetical protein
MSSKNVYRSNAENCLRMAQTTGSDHDKPFWLNLAQSWLQLAEHSARSGAEVETSETRVTATDPSQTTRRSHPLPLQRGRR